MNKTFNDLKQGDFIFVAGKFGNEIRIYDLKIQTVKNSAMKKNALLIKPVREKDFLIPEDFRELSAYDGDQYRLVATSKEALQKIAMEYSQERLRKADERIAELKAELDEAVKRRNEMSNLMASIVLS